MKNYLLCFLLVVVASPVSAQTCNSAIKPTTPTSRFLLNNKGTAIDKQTGLEWMRCALGQTWNGASCEGYASAYDWEQALDAAESTQFAGFSDWRLPNMKELASIVEQACVNSSINQTVFSAPLVHCGGGWSANLYWSSSSLSFEPSRASSVHFDGGGDRHSQKIFTNCYRIDGGAGAARLVRR